MDLYPGFSDSGIFLHLTTHAMRVIIQSQNPKQADFPNKCRHIYGLQRFVVVYHSMRGEDDGDY